MDKSLQTLTDALKKIIWQLKPNQNALSFILLLGSRNSGKTALLKQSKLEHFPISDEYHADIYYNQQGIILDINETWLNERNTILAHTLKELNRCHRLVKISGLLLVMDINALCEGETNEVNQLIKEQALLLQHFGQALNHRVDTAIIFTKLDGIAGFCDFYQNDHTTEINKPLGFSLDWGLLKGKIANNFRTRFDQWIHMLEQQVIHKLHPVRSSLKRTLIREFPLQLANLRNIIHSLVTAIPSHQCRIQAIYFTSSEQGGISIDHLNKKIKQEYALTVPDQFSQSTNYRPYFIEDALSAFQKQTQRHSLKMSYSQHIQIVALASVLGFCIAWVAHHYFAARHTLDHVSKELLAYGESDHNQNSLYHLSKATELLEKYQSNLISTSTVEKLKLALKTSTQAQLNQDFLPFMLSTIEQVLITPQESPMERYQALKIYLMLSEPKKRKNNEVIHWFTQAWKNQDQQKNIQKLTVLLQQILKSPTYSITINRQLVRDVRNYLNALPTSYLYYSLAKEQFPKTKQPISFDGFILPTKEIPAYFTKQGFNQIIKMLPEIAKKFEQENWILMRENMDAMDTYLEEAYCYDYVLWWQKFEQKTQLAHANNYQEAGQLTQALYEAEAIQHLVAFIKQQTSPDFEHQNSVFNRLVASQFTTLNLVSPASVRQLIRAIKELHPFLMTLSVVSDQGRSAFLFSKARFQNNNQTNPLSILYTEAQQFPEPITSWIKQLADDTWYLVMNDTKNYINTQWQQQVYQTYQQTISNRYPFDSSQTTEVSLSDFNQFFSSRGILQNFIDEYLKPFLDTSTAQWQSKNLDNYKLPISEDMINELIRANIITEMFFPAHQETTQVEFSLQKMNLDPIIEHFQLSLGNKTLNDSQRTDKLIQFTWPESGAKLLLSSIEGQEYELDETGPWAFFKMLQKVNVLVDEQDSRILQVLFEINGNAGRYLLKTVSPLNPFTPGILNGFTLNHSVANT